jgi:WD40 repeat protein
VQVLESDIPALLRKPAALAFSPDSRSLVLTGKNCLQVWPRWADGAPQRVVKGLNDLERFAFSPNGKHILLYLSGNSRTLRLTAAGGSPADYPVPTGPSWFHFDVDGGFIIVSHEGGLLSRYDYREDGGELLPACWTVDRCDRGSFYQFGEVRESARMFVAMEYKFNIGEPIGRHPNDWLVVRSTADGTELGREKLKKEAQSVFERAGPLWLATHPAGDCLAFPTRDRIGLWRLNGPRVPATVANTSRSLFTAVAFHPGGKYLAATSNDKTVKFYDTTSWKLAKSYTWAVGKLRAVAFSPDGMLAATVGDTGKIVIWDVDV